MGTNQEAAGPSAQGADTPQAAAALVAGYSGPALLVRPDATVIVSNEKGVNLEILLHHKAAPEIPALVAEAARTRAITVGSVSLAGTKGEILLEVTVVPRPGNPGPGDLLVLARDLTMERNLRTALVESRQRYKDLVESSSDFAWEVGVDRTFGFVSPRGALGFKAEELIGRAPADLVIDATEYAPLLFLSDRPMEAAEVWMRRADGTHACVVGSCLPLMTDDGEWRGTRGVCRDVTEDRDRESALNRARHREQVLNYIISTIRDELEPQDMLITAAAATARGLGAAGSRIYRQNEPGQFSVAAEYGDQDGIEGLDALFDPPPTDGGILDGEIGPWRVLAAVTRYRQSVNGVVCMWRRDEQGPWDDDNRILIADVANQLGIANEQIANHERIVRLSRTDALTGLLNRRAFYEEELPRRIARLEVSGQMAALFYADMDNFKRVNDVHGHQAGDEAILALREILLEHSRPGDAVARLGGDEFAMWMDGVTEDVVTARATTIIEACDDLKRFSGHEDHPLGVSLGIAVYGPRTGETLDDLLARADAAMYDVKHAGKGGFRLAPPGTVSGDAGREAKGR